jgi:hypothetical protein
MLDPLDDLAMRLLTVWARLRDGGGIQFDREDPFAKCEIPHPLDDRPAQPIRPLVVLPARLAHAFLGCLVLAQVLEPDRPSLMGQRKIDDVAGNLPRCILVEMSPDHG